jgi:predicted Zn-dependent protease
MSEIIDGKPTLRKLWLPPLCVAVALVLLGYCGYRAYEHWEPEHLVRKARESIGKKDYAAARLQLQMALQINRGSVAATRLAAEMAEEAGSLQALQWRAHVLDLAPDSLKDKLAWLRAAIRFKQPAEAMKAISTFSEVEKKNAEFESCAGELAASLGKYEEAAKHYAEAMRLDPKDETNRFGYAKAELNSEDLNLRSEGIQELKRMSADTRFSVAARRALISAFAHHEDLVQALAESEPFQGSPQAEFTDRLMHLDILQRLHRPEASAYLAGLETEAREKPLNASSLIAWMNRHGKTANALQWATTLPKSFTNTPQYAALVADCYLSARDWKKLKELTDGAKWNQLDFLRLALLARAQRESGDDFSSQSTWRSAMTAASDDWNSLDQLRLLVSTWGTDWEDQLDGIHWALCKRWADPRALQFLYAKYARDQDTRNLCEITRMMVAAEPANQVAANNYAMFSMLLKTNISEAMKTAGELYASNPGNPNFASTYAYGLYLSGHPDQGLKIMESLDQNRLSEPANAAYYGILLAAARQPAKAIEFLRIAQKDHGLLAEEQLLVEDALNNSQKMLTNGKLPKSSPPGK